MSNRVKDIALTIVGLILMAFSLTADSLGASSAPDFGWDQSLGAAIGLIIAITGVWLSQTENVISSKAIQSEFVLCSRHPMFHEGHRVKKKYKHPTYPAKQEPAVWFVSQIGKTSEY